MLDVPVLVLNRLYQPVNVTNARRALCMLYIGAARALDKDYQSFDFAGWIELPKTIDDDRVAGISYTVRIPRILVLDQYDRVPRMQIRFSRQNIYVRDDFTCQYCVRKLPRKDLNLDHVVPRSQGGKTDWENVVTSCLRCNGKKGGRTPEQAGMLLKRPPRKPRWTELVQPPRLHPRFREWLPFLHPRSFVL